MAPEKLAHHIYLQGDRVGTYAAARRILTEYCEANREKDEAVPMDLDMLQQGKGKDKGKGGQGKQWKGTVGTRQQGNRSTAALVSTLRGTAVAVASGHKSKNCRHIHGQTDAQRRELRVMEGQEGREAEGERQAPQAACATSALSLGAQIHKHDVPPVFAAATGESIVCPDCQEVLLVTKDGWRIRKKFNVISHPSVPAKPVLAFSEPEKVGCKLQLATRERKLVLPNKAEEGLRLRCAGAWPGERTLPTLTPCRKRFWKKQETTRQMKTLKLNSGCKTTDRTVDVRQQHRGNGSHTRTHRRHEDDELPIEVVSSADRSHLKPDHVDVRPPLKLDRLSPDFWGQQSIQEPQLTDLREVEAAYMAERANNGGAWILAVQEQDVTTLWKFWCRFSESTLDLPLKRRDGWTQYVKDVWKTAPKKIYKWIRGTTAFWDLAVHDDDEIAYALDDTARVELGAWSKLWRPGFPSLQRRRAPGGGSWSYHNLQDIIKHCPTGKTRGADRWGMSEIKLLPVHAVKDLATFLKCVEAKASWPPELREMLYLQLHKEEAKNAGERRPIALLPQVYRLWSACYRADVLKRRQICKDRGETLVGQGALDETFELAYLAEERSAVGKHQPGVFLD
eukprot:6490301-Amphidinium_carterae.2